METSQEATVLKILAEPRAKRQEDLAKYVSDPDATETDTDDERDSDTPVLDNFSQSDEVGAVVEMTNFTLNDFNSLWNVVEEKVESEWNTGRRRKSQHYPKDVLFMLLSTLKHAGHWDFNSKMFGVKGPTFERMIIGFAERVVDILYEIVVLRWEERYTMERLSKITAHSGITNLHCTPQTSPSRTPTALVETTRRLRGTLAANTRYMAINRRCRCCLTVLQLDAHLINQDPYQT